MEAHFICITETLPGGVKHRRYLGKNVQTGQPCWISEWIVTKPMVDIYPLIYKKREYAEESAKKIGDGAYAYSITINK